MIRKIILGIITILAAAGLFSCSTDFEINAPGQDITVVFGLLDQKDSLHYIKVTKAFIGEENALVLARDPSLSSYGDALEVYVEEINNGNVTRTFHCSKTTISNKEEGIFYYPYQDLYVFSAVLNTARSYKLTIRNNETGKIVSAQTGLIGEYDMQSLRPSFTTNTLGFVNQMGQYLTNSEVKWKRPDNARLFEPMFRFYYTEIDTVTHDTATRFVDWKLGSHKSSLLTGDETMSVSYSGESFYSLLKSNIPVDNRKIRKHGKVWFILSAGGDELSTYIDLNRPSNSIIQERPAFTNVSNGIGIFSCRRTISHSYNLTPASVNELINGQYTSDLGFQ